MQKGIQQTLAVLTLILLLTAGCSSTSIPQTGATAVPTAANPANTLPSTTSPMATTAATTGAPAATTAATAGATSAATAAATNAAASPSTNGIQYTIVPDKSEASYRVREQLANVALPSDAIGKTNQISGAVVVNADGSIDSASSKITVNLTNLQSDRSMRDNFVRRNVLQTDQFPNAVFVPTKVSGLPSPLPQSGQVSFKVDGNLTIRDVTKPVTWDVTGTVQNGTATGLAKTSFTFADFNLNQPRVPIVLSVEDKIGLEINVTLQQSASSGQSSTGNVASTPTTAAAQAAQPAANCTSPAKLTDAATEGPYFKAGSPERSTLADGLPGTKLTLSGYVLTQDCKPVSNAVLDFWQADSQGQYDNAGYTLRGHLSTDASGRYQLDTIVPGLYPGRTEHIHVKVQAPGGPILTTQLFFPNVSQNQSDGIYDNNLLIQVQQASGGLNGTFNFIIAVM